MADNEETIVKRKRGRPPKKKKEAISEQNKVLMMAGEKDQVTIKNVEDSLTSLFSAAGVKSNKFNFFENGDLGVGNNPWLQNNRLKIISGLPTQMARDDLIKALADPTDSEEPLRGQGMSLSSSQYLYYKILRMSADIPLYKHYIIPEYLENPEEYKKPKFVKEAAYVEDWLTKFDLVNTLKKTSLEVKREGKCVYLLRNSIEIDPVNNERYVNFCTWQKLPNNYVKIVGIGEHGYIAAFNMLLFMNPAFMTSQYPDFIGQIWDDMVNSGAVTASKKEYTPNLNKIREYKYKYTGKNGYELLKGTLEAKVIKGSAERRYNFWVTLPQELCYVFCSDTSSPWVIPDTSGMFLGLQELTDYDNLAGLLQSSPLTSVLTAEMETIPQPNAGKDQTIMSPETILGFQDKFNDAASGNIQAFFAPLKNFKLQTLPSVPNATDTTTNATKNFIYRNGFGGLLITTDKPTVSQVRVAMLLAAAEADFLTEQYSSVLNMIINDLIGCEYDWKLHIWGNIFTFQDEVKSTKELFVSGGVFALPKLASAYNLTLRDTKAVDTYIHSLGIYNDFKTVTQSMLQSYTGNTGEDKKKQGRPGISESDIENDATAASKDSGLDTSETRMSVANVKCKICGKEMSSIEVSLDDDGLLICEECKERILNEQGE